MLILVAGGSGSGKSEFAENMAASAGGHLIYVATMKPWGEEGIKRIEKHRKQREGKGFETIERCTDVGSLDTEGTVLLEDLGNLVANEMFEGDTKRVLSGILELNKKCSDLIIVTDNVFEDGNIYDGDTERYIEFMGMLNCRIAAEADRVYEVICGIPTLIYSREGKK